jgi:hypothetical protein
MSYDLIMWKVNNQEHTTAQEIWSRLCEESPVENLESIGLEETIQAMKEIFSDELQIGEGYLENSKLIEGPGFEVNVSHSNTHLHITCAWGLLKEQRGLVILDRLALVLGRLLTCTCYDPQVEEEVSESFASVVKA